MARERWIDVAKGLGIILVVEAHIDPSRFSKFIFLFHMPLFIMLSGMLMRPSPWMDTVKKKAWTLLVPYVCYLLLLGALEIKRSPVPTLEAFVFGGRLLAGNFGVFWFVTCLFLAQLIFAVLLNWKRKSLDPWLVASVFSLTLLGYWTAQFSLPWNAGVVPVAVFFLWAGYALKEVGISRNITLLSLGGSVLATFWFFTASPPAFFDMKAGAFGLPLVGLVQAVAMSIVVIALSKAIAASKFAAMTLAYIGAASLTIMFLHQFVHFTAAYRGLSIFTQFVLALILSIAAHHVFGRVPVLSSFLLGKRSA